MKLPEDIQDIIVEYVLGMRHKEKFNPTLDRIKLIDRTVITRRPDIGMVIIRAWAPRKLCVSGTYKWWKWRYTWFRIHGKMALAADSGIIPDPDWRYG